ncbi:MAG: C40 family peptidase, partial [Atopobiaceae bacterium]|nr:C40 family peptidase [Atopobiaceae bacterium]
DQPKQENAASKSETSTSTQAQESKPEASTTGSGSSTQPEESKQEPAQGTAQETPSEDAGSSQSQPQAETPTTNSSTSGTFGGAGVDSAYSCIGCPYVWGAAGPNSFDCSGLVCYCYGYGRGRTTYDMISSLKASGDWKTNMSQLSYGDLIFTSTGHVGIYLGNGTFIHAPAPGRTVRVQEVFSFVGGGTY